MLLDIKLLRNVGIDIIHNIKTSSPQLPLILTGQASTEKLVECIRLGADDFIEKPGENSEILRKSISRLLTKSGGDADSEVQKEIDQISRQSNRLVGQSEAILVLKRQIYKIAPLDSTVLIMGETGTGKEVVARMIHSLSPKGHKNFIAVHCGGIPDTLLESALFGHEKGSFTGAYRNQKGYFEIANEGTIFLDEIGDTTPSFQVKLLRILQDKQFRRVGGTETLTTSARVLAATNRDLRRMVDESKFREDLYYRLHVITLTVPPLRERPEDIPLLVRHFMRIYTRKHNRLGYYLQPETVEILKNLSWKGNVRELENVIERLVALTDTDWIGPSELPEEYLQIQRSPTPEQVALLPYAEAKNLFEREYVARLLKRTNGNVSRAAKMANMPRQNLHLKIKKHNLKSRSAQPSSPVKEKEPVEAAD